MRHNSIMLRFGGRDLLGSMAVAFTRDPDRREIVYIPGIEYVSDNVDIASDKYAHSPGQLPQATSRLENLASIR